MLAKHSKIVSLSHPITARMPLWPGDPPVVFEDVASLEKDGYFLRRCTTLEKTMLLAGAACVVYPSAVTDLTGLGLGAAVLLMQRLRPAEA